MEFLSPSSSAGCRDFSCCSCFDLQDVGVTFAVRCNTKHFHLLFILFDISYPGQSNEYRTHECCTQVTTMTSLLVQRNVSRNTKNVRLTRQETKRQEVIFIFEKLRPLEF